MADFGNFALMLACALAIFGTVASFLAASQARERFRKAAIRAYAGSGLMVVLALFSLGYMLQTDAFEMVYVYGHSNHTLERIFKLTAIWAGSEGSLLWWTLILMVYTTIFLVMTRKAPRLMTSWALFFIGLNIIFFLVINNFVANPFHQWSQVTAAGTGAFVPQDGQGLNPQLQHWAMIIHPPLLYTGYIGFLFPFGLTLGALISRLEGRQWLPMVRRWTLIPWLILGIGIILGGAWAYMELGWGGYWAWDPVENASFMPWLLATAFLHSIMAQESRGIFKLWNVLLLAGAYLMCMLGTGITRSGFISSVHAFAESTIGWYFLVFIFAVILLTGIVIFARRDQFTPDNAVISPTSREVGLLFNNLLFIAACATILLGTVYPVIYEALYGVKRELRHGYYNLVEPAIFLLIVLLMAAGPILNWKNTTSARIRERFLWPTVLMVLVCILGFVLNPTGFYSNISFGALTFLTFTLLQEFVTVIGRRARRAGENVLVASYSVVAMNKRRYGGFIAHLSILVIAIGLTGAAFNQQAKEEIGVGESIEVAGFNFQVGSISFKKEQNFTAMVADINLMGATGKVVKAFRPEQRRYNASDTQASEVAIWSTLARDYYVVLAGPGDGSTAEHPIGIFHVYVNPLVVYVWAGGIMMILATVICMLPDRVRSRATAPSAVAAEVTA